VGTFLVGAELRSNEARLSLTGLHYKKYLNIINIDSGETPLNLRGINDTVQRIQAREANWPGLRHSRWALLQDILSFQQSKQTSGPGIERKLRRAGRRCRGIRC